MTGGGPFVLDDRVFRLLAALVEEYAGLRYEPAHRDLFAERLGRRVAALGLPGFLDYYYRLKYDPDGREELQRAVEELTINETYFFREEGPLEALLDHWVPARRGEGGPFRVWSAACSTGAEPYTLAILAEERGMGEGLEIWGSDIDREALETARRGEYRQGALRTTDEARRERWFEALGNGRWRLKDPPRGRVRFFWANLLDPGEAAAPGRWDAILCRNALIYWGAATAERVLGQFHRALRPGGALLVGLTESLLRFDTPFRIEEVGGWFFYVREA